MRSSSKKPVFYYQADAHAIGGSLTTPEPKTIAAQACTTLPAAGGSATTSVGVSSLEQIVSFKSAYTRLSGREIDENGSVSTLVTSVIEGLNILEVVTADRIVAQIAIEGPVEIDVNGRLVMTRRRISVAGSRFEGLRLAGILATPVLNTTLLQSKHKREQPSITPNTWLNFQRVGVGQAKRLVDEIDGGDYRDMEWVRDRYAWMTENRPEEGFALCSLVDDIGSAVPGTALCHIVDIPDFGRIFLGELLVSPLSVKLTMVRAELGCNFSGALVVAQAHSNGTTVPPGQN